MKTVTIECGICHQKHEVTAPESEFSAWESGALIQRAMPSLNDNQRELLISETCGPCFDSLFEEDEYEYAD